MKNKGPSLIQEAEVYILWPSFTGNLDSEGQAEDLLYLLPGVEYDHSKVTCQNIKNINPRYIKVRLALVTLNKVIKSCITT